MGIYIYIALFFVLIALVWMLIQSKRKQKQLEQNLIKQQSLAEVGMLTAGLCHEIKNALNFVVNFSELSKRELENISEAETKTTLQENLNTISESGKRAVKLTALMLDQSKSNEEAKPIDLRELIEPLLILSIKSKRYKNLNFKPEYEVMGESLPISISKHDAGTIFFNLIDNSLHSLLEKSKRIEGFQPKISVTFEQDPQFLKVSVFDNGLGLSKKAKAQALTPFFTTKGSEGTGLGLTLSKNLLEKQNGKLEVESEEGEFAKFTVYLPRKP